MPYPDSEYPSILRGKDKRESQRLLAAAPDLLRALKNVAAQCNCALDYVGVDDAHTLQRALNRVGNARKECEGAIAKAEGRE
jgi:hypothetical protein